ncbi:hypothetical protein Tco_0657273 [Tanacetum coccineum]|uniref:Uncharacterized protein n=1 Tax=Tanacetum coccineum TaxID=301880 RepID=A0ABQ4XBB3_9ASTR
MLMQIHAWDICDCSVTSLEKAEELDQNYVLETELEKVNQFCSVLDITNTNALAKATKPHMLMQIHEKDIFSDERLNRQFSSLMAFSSEGSGFESMFSIPSSTINFLKVGSFRGLVKISAS